MNNQLKYGSHVLVLAWFVALVLLACVVVYEQRPPSATPVNTAATDFSSARALKHIAAIAKQTHPIGSAQQREVREYILAELRAAGLTPEVQQTTSFNTDGTAAVAATVQNIVARMPGTSNTKAVLLMGHYDSAPNSLGAADDGSGVATLLETVRALKSAPPLKNDTIFLFTDGEEAGLLGSIAFVKEHPWAKDVGLVLNFEARGSSGPSFMFETSDGNGWLISEFVKAAPYPVSTSILYDIYRALPNDTDLTPFKKAGVAGLNFAFIDDEVYYHSPNDRVEKLDEQSLQHHGSYAVALTRHFGNVSLENRKASNAVYFNIFGSRLVHYSVAWVMPLAVICLGLFVIVVVLGLKRKRLTLRGIVAGVLLFLVSFVVAAISVSVLWFVILKLNPQYSGQQTGAIYRSGLYMVGFTALTIAITALLYAWFNKKVLLENLFTGALFWWLMLCVLTALVLPGTSYLFSWPLLFVLLGFAYVLLRQQHQIAKSALVFSVCVVPGVLLMAPAIHLVFVALTVTFSGVAAILIVFLLGLMIPLLCLMTAGNKWLLPGAAGLVGVVYLVFAGVTLRTSPAYPRPDNVFYCMNAETGQAMWNSVDAEADEWTGNYFKGSTERGSLKECLPQSSRTFLKSAAAVAPFEAPHAEVISRENNTLRLRLSSPRGANAISIFFEPDAELVKAAVNDKAVLSRTSAEVNKGWYLYYYALPPEGVVLTVERNSAKPLTVRVIDLSYGLPPVNGLLKRPDQFIPSMYFVSDATLVGKSFTF